MTKNKSQRTIQLLSSIGLLLVAVPQLLRDYVFIPDFFRGFLAGIGLAIMIGGLVWQKKFRTTNTNDEQAGISSNQ